MRSMKKLVLALTVIGSVHLPRPSVAQLTNPEEVYLEFIANLLDVDERGAMLARISTPDAMLDSLSVLHTWYATNPISCFDTNRIQAVIERARPVFERVAAHPNPEARRLPSYVRAKNRLGSQVVHLSEFRALLIHVKEKDPGTWKFLPELCDLLQVIP